MTTAVRPAAMRAVLGYGVLLVVGASSLWFDYPVVIGGHPVRLLLFREAIIGAGVAAIWARVLVGFSLVGAPGPRLPSQSRPWLTLWPSIALVLSLFVMFVPMWRADLLTGNGFLHILADRPWRLFLPSHMWSGGSWSDGMYRPVGVMFTGLVVLLAPKLLMITSVALHVANAVLVTRVAALFWPERRGVAFLAGLLAGASPHVLGTVLEPRAQPYLLFSGLYLVAILAFETGLRRATWWPIVICSLCLIAADLCVEFAVTLPVALLCMSLATGSLRRQPRFGLIALGVQGTLTALYLAGYMVYLNTVAVAYLQAVHHPSRSGFFFPINVKRIVLSLTYLPFWSYLFPFDASMRSHPWAPDLTWLSPILALPVLWIGKTRAWRDRGFCFSVVAASLAVLPAANFFDLAWGTSERYGHLAFLWMSLAFAWLIGEWTTGPFSYRWLKVAAWTTSAATLAAIALLSGVRYRELIRTVTSLDRIADVAVLHTPDRDEFRRIEVLNLDDGTFWDFGAVMTNRVSSLLPRSTVRLEGHPASWDTVLRGPVGDDRRSLTVEWSETYLDGAIGLVGPIPQENVWCWDTTHDAYVDITETLRRKYAAAGGGAIHAQRVMAGEGLAASRPDEWIGNGGKARLEIPIDRTTPMAGDELILRMTVSPLGFQPPTVASEATLQWGRAENTCTRNQTVIPLVADGIPTEYRLRLGTSASWLISGAVDHLSIRLPNYPLQVRLVQP